MMSRSLLVLTALVAAGSNACNPDSSLPPPRAPEGVQGPGGPALHNEAVRELTSVKVTEYRHASHVDESQGVYEYDCSGFVGYAISNVAPDALDVVRRTVGKKRPTADSYVTLLRNMAPGQKRGRWLHVPDVAAIEPGDIVAWTAVSLKPDEWGSVNTGHVMIVDGPSRERSPGEWVVPVIDSSGGHGGADLRKKPDATGLGRGTVVLIVRDGYVVGYRWSESARSVLNTTSVMVGRIL